MKVDVQVSSFILSPIIPNRADINFHNSWL